MTYQLLIFICYIYFLETILPYHVVSYSQPEGLGDLHFVLSVSPHFASSNC